MQDDLFARNERERIKRNAPLAVRMRPQNLKEFLGQEHILGKDSLLERLIERDKLSSIILYGPPGSGKTTLAQVIANRTKARFVRLNAVTSGVKDIRKIIEDARERLTLYDTQTVLFIDEIHRFNKSQQDALLPAVENGLVTLIGATTENPYFEVNPPLVSRCRIFRLEPLSDEHIAKIIDRALVDERGLGRFNVTISREAKEHLVKVSGGDARSALNALEMAYLAQEGHPVHIDLKTAAEAVQQRAVRYDKAGDNHYDTISAFIKSMRGGDPDAAVYYLAKMIYAGEDPNFIARRIVICAAEDVGCADPMALVVANSAREAAHFVGFPEARIPLAMAAVYVATAPKSNAAYLAVDRALEDVKSEEAHDVPVHLRDASYKGAKEFGHGVGYKYPHDFPGHHVRQEYLPARLRGRRYYTPDGEGWEAEIIKRLAKWWGEDDKEG